MVVVPESVVRAAREASEGRGSKKMALIMDYVTAHLRPGEKVIDWQRGQGEALIAVTE